MDLVGLGYVGLATAKLDEWVTFATDLLGMAIAERRDDGSVRLRIDDHAYRVELRPADGEGVDRIGWEVRDEAALEAVAAELERAGIPFERVAGARARADRAVAEYVAFTDPAGIPVEFFWGARTEGTAFASPLGRRFVTGDMGIGHVFFVIDAFEETRRLYERLGFRLSDQYADGTVLFYRCNPRQHSFGIADASAGLPFPAGLNHFMVEVDDIDAMGVAYDACVDGAAPLSTTIGRHTNDHMISFYVHTPSGFEMEYGFGGRRVDEATWTVADLGAESIWGHRPVSQPALAGASDAG